MKHKNKTIVTRRAFLGTAAAAAAAFSVIPMGSGCTKEIPPSVTGVGTPNSKFGGVQIGAITYSWRSMPSSAEEVLQYCIQSGISSIELMGNVAETYAGLPAAPAQPARDAVLTPEEKAAYDAAAAAATEERRKWRTSVAMTKFEELRTMYNEAGVDIHIAKFSPANWTDEEIDYAFNAAKALGAKAVCNEVSEEACKRLAPFADKHGLYAVFHNHAQFATEGFTVDPFLALSPNVMLNFDAGHYAGSTGLNPVEFITKYHHRILSLHLKDKTGPKTDPPNTNQVWGQGETPLAEVLLLLKAHADEEGWPKYADIELEYEIKPWSDAVKEVRKCVNYARGILV